MHSIVKMKGKYYFRPSVTVECNGHSGLLLTFVSGSMYNFAVFGVLPLCLNVKKIVKIKFDAYLTPCAGGLLHTPTALCPGSETSIPIVYDIAYDRA